jgi:hypothetical protein
MASSDVLLAGECQRYAADLDYRQSQVAKKKAWETNARR